MSGQRRRPNNPGGEQPPGHGPDSGHPYAYGTPVEGAPSYGRGQNRDELRSEGIRRGARETAQQPRMTRAEMRKQGRKGGGAGDGSGAGGGGRRGAGTAPAGRGGRPGKKRLIDYPRFGKAGFRRWVPSWKQVLSLFLIFFGGGVAAVGAAYAMTPVPDPKDFIHDQNNIYYWADGSEMTRKGDTNRQLVELSAISREAQDAVIAAENETFRSDSGIDPKGIGRAVYKMATGGETQGGSTITQQYVKNAYLSQDQTLTRKVKEFFITLKINGDQTKDQILTGYLNTAWYGRGATGIQAAAQAYYGVDAKDLNACQGAMLAGLLKGAALYDPSITANHQRAVDRWKWILDRMVITKALTADQRAKCADFPEPIKQKASANMNGEVYYLVETANKYLAAKGIPQASIDRGGYSIYTTFQKDKVESLKKAVDEFQSQTLKPDKRNEDKFVQIGAASVVPNDGAIVAIYGGAGIENGHYTNNADGTGIPVGSTFKPLVLATAMQTGVLTKQGEDGKPARISPESLYLADDMAQIYKKDGTPVMGDDGKPYKQRNSSPGKKGYVSLKTAMQYSYNVPFVQLGQDVGGKNVEDMVIKLGLRKESLAPSSTLTFPLGTSTPSAIRMASAYSVFAARGQQTDPYSVAKVIEKGKELPQFTKPQAKTALDQPVADTITDVLQNVAKNGTGSKTRELGFPVAGKTGTTDAGTSAWWVGYTPSLATSVGMWREEPGKPGLLSLDGTAGKSEIHGGDFPADIFTRYMKVVGPGQPKEFPVSEPFGEKVDSSGAPVSPSASPSDSASPSATPSATAEASPSASSGPSPSTSPSPSSSQSCLLGLCPPSRSPGGGGGKPTPTKTPSPTDTTTASPPAGGAGQ
ncbi:transglycosylase domain-containing protein [Kitasatospora sp. NPDC048365]|uniref:transglycosylase domain-containing protein n=1 Tax=Kitasatospora sp. NPDC048365 TaxID=3364050 RepID=UPI003710C8D4